VVERQAVDVEVGQDLDRLGRDPQATRDLRALAVERRQQQAVQLAAGQVVVDLQCHRALARSHRAEVEAQCGHATLDPNGWPGRVDECGTGAGQWSSEASRPWSRSLSCRQICRSTSPTSPSTNCSAASPPRPTTGSPACTKPVAGSGFPTSVGTTTRSRRSSRPPACGSGTRRPIGGGPTSCSSGPSAASIASPAGCGSGTRAHAASCSRPVATSSRCASRG
jgi:hypothetical protein